MSDDLAPIDDDDDAFPASENTPGQAESRGAYARFQQWVQAVETQDGEAVELPRVLAPNVPGKSILDNKPEWLRDYLALRSEGWMWRKAAYIAWASSPTGNRWPASQVELARLVLGLRSDRTIRKWHENDPTVAERIERMKIEPLLIHRRDVIDALVTVAKTPDPKANPDRKMFLEMTGDYKPKGQVALTAPNGGPLQIQTADQFEDLSDEQLDQLISNLQAAG
jgi:hypothetical protein